MQGKEENDTLKARRKKHHFCLTENENASHPVASAAAIALLSNTSLRSFGKPPTLNLCVCVGVGGVAGV